MINFTTGFALHIQLFCIVTLTVNCPNEACYSMQNYFEKSFVGKIIMTQNSMCVVDEKIHVIYSHVMFISYFLLTSKQQYHDLTTYYNS